MTEFGGSKPGPHNSDVPLSAGFVQSWWPPRLSQTMRTAATTILIDKILLTIILTVASYAAQKYIDSRTIQQATLQSSLLSVTAMRSDFLKQQRNELATSMMTSLSGIDVGDAVTSGGRALRDELTARLSSVREKLTLLSSVVVAMDAASNTLAIDGPARPMQRAITGLLIASTNLTVATDAFDQTIRSVLAANPGLDARWSEPRVVPAEGLVALAGVVSSGEGKLIQAYSSVLAALDAVLVEEVRLDLMTARSMARAPG